MKAKPAKADGTVLLEVTDHDAERLATNRAPSLFKIQKILVPIDFSRCSEKGLHYARAFAGQFKASLVLAHVVQFNPIPGTEFSEVDFPAVEQRVLQQSKEELEKTAAALRSDDLNIETLLREGRPATEIASIARETNADLIIISTHGHTGLKHVLLGSVAENVVRHAPCPVLVVRENEHEFV
jgi:universal stress protein A